MLFNTNVFVVFISVVLLLILLFPKKSWVTLLGASYVFYMYWKWEYIFLILFSTIVDYLCALGIDKNSENSFIPLINIERKVPLPS